MLRQLLNDEAGFIVSAELVLVATILVLGMIVGLSQVQHAVVEELNDVAHAIGALNQSYEYTGFSSEKANGAIKAVTFGSSFEDHQDTCDLNCNAIACDAPAAECTALP
jgi:Flp pilus assembly pilin Flp